MIGIVGCGLAAVSLGKVLHDNSVDFKIYADDKPSASRISSGIINPITGRRYALTWNYNTFRDTALEFYGNFIVKMPISRFYKPFSQDSSIYEDLKDKEEWAVIENSQWVDIHDSYQLQVSDFMDHWLRIFEKEDRVLHHSFQHEALETDNNELKYDDFIFDAIIFAEGIGIVNNPFFNKLPIKPNRGEALKIKVRDFRLSKIIQKGKFICPFEGDYWIGSSYENVEHLQISKTSKILEELKDAIPVLIGPKDVEMIEHLGAFRVTIGDRRPIIGAHQKFGNLFLFNGFGTKGASLIPYFARELTNHILLSQEMNMEVRLSRFIKTI